MNVFYRSATFALCLILAGCGSIGKSYSQIDPEGAERDIKENNGYFALKTVNPGAAKLVMRAEGMPAPAGFSTSTSTKECEDFSRPEMVRDGGHGVLLPWIAKMTAGRGFVEKELAPQQPVQVRAYSNWWSAMSFGPGVPGVTSHGICGPIVLRFTPQVNRAYLARFVYPGQGCQLIIEDATNPDVPITVDSEAITSCPKP